MRHGLIVVAVASILLLAMVASAAATKITTTIDFVNAPSSVDGGDVNIYVADTLSLANHTTVSGTQATADLDNNTGYILKGDFGGFCVISYFEVVSTRNAYYVSVDFSKLAKTSYNVTGYDSPVDFDVEVNYSTTFSPALAVTTSKDLYFDSPIRVTFPEKIGGGLEYYALKSIELDGQAVDNGFVVDPQGNHTITVVYEKTYGIPGIPSLDFQTIIIILAVIAIIAIGVFIVLRKAPSATVKISAIESDYIE